MAESAIGIAHADQYDSEIENPIALIDGETACGLNLRQYQQNAINKISQKFSRNKKRVVLQLACGGGKSVIAAEMIRRAVEKGKRALFVADILTLIDQTSDVFDSLGLRHGIIQGNNIRHRPDLPIQICSIQTLNRRQLPDADLVIIDEVHCFHETHKKLMEHLPNAFFVGLSATPWRKGLGKYFDSLVVGATVLELISQGYLVDATVYGPVTPDLAGVPTAGGDWVKGKLAKQVDTYVLNGKIVDHWLKLGENRQTICFAVNIAHSKHIVERFNSAGISAAHIDCFTKRPDRYPVIEGFKRGDIRILSSVGILSKGFDYPGAGACIMARPTKSYMLFIQMLGRAIRCFEGKTDAIVLDHAGNTERHGFITDRQPTWLDNGDERNKANERVSNEPLPKPCPNCFFLKNPKELICPNCGFEAKVQNEITESDEPLILLNKAMKQDKTAIPNESFDFLKTSDIQQEKKQQFYSELLELARLSGYKRSWVGRMYKARFGESPNGLKSEHSAHISETTWRFVERVTIDYWETNGRTVRFR